MHMPMTRLLTPSIFHGPEILGGVSFFAASLNISLHYQEAPWIYFEHCGGITSVPSKQRIQASLALTHKHNCHEKLPGILSCLCTCFTLQWKPEWQGTYANWTSSWQHLIHLLNSRYYLQTSFLASFPSSYPSIQCPQLPKTWWQMPFWWETRNSFLIQQITSCLWNARSNLVQLPVHLQSAYQLALDTNLIKSVCWNFIWFHLRSVIPLARSW